ncbi:MAG: hypothetical protein ACLRSW_08380 [Christensenellaceae bacterium]
MSDEHFAVMEKAAKTRELGQKSVTVLLGDCPGGAGAVTLCKAPRGAVRIFYGPRRQKTTKFFV